MKRSKLLAALTALMLILAACSSDAGPDTTVDAGGGGGGGGGKLADVIAADVIVCGVNDGLPGFGIVDAGGEYVGFDVDFCRVVAAGILGDADKVQYKPLIADVWFTALQSGDIDLLIRNTTWTATGDGQQGANFLFTTFYDGQGMMVPASKGFTTLEDLADANICMLSGTATELNLTAVFNARRIPFDGVVFGDNAQLNLAYQEGRCEAWTSDASQLAAFKSSIEGAGGPEQFIMAEIISKEPWGPVVADGDHEWAQAVEWSVMATVQAWEFGLDSGNIDSYTGTNPNVLNFIGDAGFDPGVGLPSDFAVQVVTQVGNYEEIFNRHILAIGVSLAGGPNNIWSAGGLMYVPPYR